jgi:hypothetical protein
MRRIATADYLCYGQAQVHRRDHGHLELIALRSFQCLDARRVSQLKNEARALVLAGENLEERSVSAPPSYGAVPVSGSGNCAEDQPTTTDRRFLTAARAG